MSAHEKIKGMLPSPNLGEQVAQEILAEHRLEIAETVRPQNMTTEVWMEMFNVVMATLPKQTTSGQVEAVLTAVLNRASNLIGKGE